MPTVPTYDNFTVKPTVNPDVRVTAPEIQDFSAKQAALSGQAMQTAGSAVARIGADIQNEANMVRADDATNQFQEAALALQYDRAAGFASVTSESALNRESGKPLAVEYQEKLQQKIDEIGSKLGNEQQRKMFGQRARSILMSFYTKATIHENKQFQDYTLSVQEGTIKNASNAIVLNPLDTANVEANLAEINRAIYTTGKLKGMSAQLIESVQREAASSTHLNVIKALLTPNEKGEVNTEGAEAYFKQYGGQFNGVQKAEAAKLVGAADQARAAINGASEIWNQFGPKATPENPNIYNQPVDIFAMEEQVRQRYKDKPAVGKAVIDELRSRKQAFDSSQSEFVASNVNEVSRLLMTGAGMNKVRASAAFQALPESNQRQIIDHENDRAHILSQRASADRNRAEIELARKNFAAYLDYSNPEKLAGMTRQQVEALWPALGRDQTSTLVQRWDSLQNKDARLTATMDQSQFNAIAQDLGFRPYDSSKSESKKAELGRVHYQINQILDAEAKAKRQPLTPQEKEGIMRREMAKMVTVQGEWFGTDEVRLPQLTDEQASRVVVPKTQRAALASEMAQLYAVRKNKAFAPTEENLRNYYLLKIRSERP